MRLAAKLTTGWNDDPSRDFAAVKLHQQASEAGHNYTGALVDALRCAPAGTQILGLERLFRRCTSGFQDIKRFVGSLAAIQDDSLDPGPLVCRIDVFAYAFLKGAKNFDLLLPLIESANKDFRCTREKWSNTLAGLADFERLGVSPRDDASVSVEDYLAMRKVVSRPSARDERRALATLLISGPSTLDEIGDDLGLNYPLGQRTLAVFEQIGVVERRAGERPDAPLFAIAQSALPLTVFCLRETMGLDLLEALPKEN